MSETAGASGAYFADGDGKDVLPFDTEEADHYNSMNVRHVYRAVERWGRTTYVKPRQIESVVDLPRSTVGRCMGVIARETELLEEYAPERPENRVFVVVGQ